MIKHRTYLCYGCCSAVICPKCIVLSCRAVQIDNSGGDGTSQAFSEAYDLNNNTKGQARDSETQSQRDAEHEASPESGNSRADNAGGTALGHVGQRKADARIEQKMQDNGAVVGALSACCASCSAKKCIWSDRARLA